MSYYTQICDEQSLVSAYQRLQYSHFRRYLSKYNFEWKRAHFYTDGDLHSNVINVFTAKECVGRDKLIIIQTCAMTTPS